MKSKAIISGLSILLISVASSCKAVMPSQTELAVKPVVLPNPSGHFSIGMKGYQFNDPSRPDPFSSEASIRELTVNVYYPAINKRENKELPYIRPKMLEYYKREMPKGGLDGRYLENIATEVFSDAPILTEQQRFPVIILSPGGGVVPEFYLSQIKQLVSHGFVVVAINHTYISPISIFPDGTAKIPGEAASQYKKKILQPGSDAQGEFITIQFRDIDLVLRSLPSIDLHDHLDLSNIGMLGHSVGGVSSVYYCLNYLNCRAGVNMDGAFRKAPTDLLKVGRASREQTKSILFLAGKSIHQSIPTKSNTLYADKEILDALAKIDPDFRLDEYHAFKGRRHQGRVLNSRRKDGIGASLIVFDDVEHMAFSDWRLINSHLLNSSDKSDLFLFMNELNQIVLNFFSSHMKNERMPLLNGLNK